MGITYWCCGEAKFGSTESIFYTALILIWITSAASFGHVVNDYYDAELDMLVGKKPMIHFYTKWLQWLVLTALCFLIVMPIFLFAKTKLTMVWVVAQMLLFIFYSNPIIRLKEKGWAGIIADSFYAYLLPALIILSYTGIFETIRLIVYVPGAIWLVAQGVRNILLHQISDREADRKAYVETIATKNGEHRVFQWINFIILPVEVLSLIILLTQAMPGSMAISVIILILWGALKLSIDTMVLKHSDPWYHMNHPSFSLMNNFYEQILPLYILIALISDNPFYILFLLLHVTLFLKPFLDLIRSLNDFFKRFKFQND